MESTNNPLSLRDLFNKYLSRQIEIQARGLGLADPDADVTPYDAVPVQPVEPALAWQDALAAAGTVIDCPVPPEWPNLVRLQESAVTIPFCLGNYPQLVRSLQSVLAGEPIELAHVDKAPADLPMLVAWAEKQTEEPARYVAAGVVRLAGRFDLAKQLLNPESSPSWQSVRANELAALAWHQGNSAEALRLWKGQEDSVPVLFNRGMAALFLGEIDLADASLEAVVQQLPETSAWHHLAELYRVLARTRTNA